VAAVTAIGTRYGAPEGLSQADADASHPGFAITCCACGSTLVYIETDLDFSAQSGAWGAVSLTCFTCGATVEVLSS
jgi:hypothetical protein